MTSGSYNSFADLMHSGEGYQLSEVKFDILNPTTAIFKAKLNAPTGKPVWARAWLSTEEGTLAEAVSPQMRAGDAVTLEVKLKTEEKPQFAYVRIESSLLKTEHIVVLRLV